MKITKIISKDNIEKKYVIVVTALILLALISAISTGYINFLEVDIKVIFLPAFVIGTLITHELIHISLFEIFSKGKADVEVLVDRALGAIVVYQKNKNVFYNKLQTIIILLAPVIIITLISLIRIEINPEWSMVLKVNMLLNILGSLTDIVLSLKLISCKGNIRINYDFEEDKGILVCVHERS